MGTHTSDEPVGSWPSDVASRAASSSGSASVPSRHHEAINRVDSTVAAHGSQASDKLNRDASSASVSGPPKKRVHGSGAPRQLA